LEVDSEHLARRAHLLARKQGPGPGRGSEVQDLHARPQDLGLVLDLLELEDAARRIALLLRLASPRVTDVRVRVLVRHGAPSHHRKGPRCQTGGPSRSRTRSSEQSATSVRGKTFLMASV